MQRPPPWVRPAQRPPPPPRRGTPPLPFACTRAASSSSPPPPPPPPRRAPRQYAFCQRCRIVNQLAARARAAGAQKDYTGRDLYAADHQRAVLPEHIATAARPRAASVWLPFACFQSIVCSARHLTASCTILLQNLHSRE